MNMQRAEQYLDSLLFKTIRYNVGKASFSRRRLFKLHFPAFSAILLRYEKFEINQKRRNLERKTKEKQFASSSLTRISKHFDSI